MSILGKAQASTATDTDSKGRTSKTTNDYEQEAGSPILTFEENSPKLRGLAQSQSKEEKILNRQSYFLVEPSYLNKLRHYCSSDNSSLLEIENLKEKPTVPKGKKTILKSKATVKSGIPIRPPKRGSIVTPSDVILSTLPKYHKAGTL